MAVGVPQADAEAAVRDQWDVVERRDDAASRGIKVLRENMQAVALFVRLRNRWVVHGFSGRRVGLLATDIQATMGMMGVRKKQQDALLAKVEVLEEAALKVWQRE